MTAIVEKWNSLPAFVRYAIMGMGGIMVVAMIASNV